MEFDVLSRYAALRRETKRDDNGDKGWRETVAAAATE